MAVAALNLPLNSISARGERWEVGKYLCGVGRLLLSRDARDRGEAVLWKEANGGIRANRFSKGQANF